MGKTLFICYARDDMPWLDRLTKQLASLRNDGVRSEVWDDRHLRALDEREWEVILLPKLKTADCIVVLLSANSAASNYIQTTELPIALARKASGDAKVMLVYLKPYPIEKRLEAFQIGPSVEVAVIETHSSQNCERDPRSPATAR